MSRHKLRFWCDFFDPSTVKRGLRQFERRAVSKLKLGDAALMADVAGDTDDYRVVVVWRARKDTQFAGLDAICTCPVGAQCKHAVAVCAELLKQERGGKMIPVATPRTIRSAKDTIQDELFFDEDDETEDDDDWEDDESPPSAPVGSRLKKRMSAPAAVVKSNPATVTLPTPPPDPHQLSPVVTLAHEVATSQNQELWLRTLMVQQQQADAEAAPVVALLTRHPTYGWQILPVLTHLRQDRRWGIGKRYRSWRDLLMGSMNTLPISMQRLARQAAAWQQSHYGEDGLLSFAESTHLEALLQAGVLALEPIQGGPVSRGPERPGTFAWVESKQGWRLQLRVEGLSRSGELMRLDCLWWLDAGARQIGRVDVGLAESALAQLLDMPALPLPLVGEAAERLRRIWPELPPPPAAPLPEVPVPVLRTWRAKLQTTDWQRQQRPCELGLVSFRYGTVEVAAAGAMMIRHQNRTIVRNLEAETARLADIARAGLVSLAETPTVDVLKCEHARATLFKPVEEPDLPLAGLALLRATGWEISGLPVAEVPISDLDGLAAEVSEDGGWFDLALGTQIDGERVDLVPLLTPLLGRGPVAWATLPTVDGCLLVPHGRERLLRVPLELLQRLHDHLLALFSRERATAWKLNAWDAGVIAALDGLGVPVLGAERLRRIADTLAAPLEAAPQPSGLQAVLRPYQREGLAWLQRLRAVGLGGVLADDMGLGKTMQLIAHAVVEHAAGRLDRPCLVVCPASLIGTWQRELQRFAPQLTPQLLHGNRRDHSVLKPGVIGITTYGVLSRDIDRLEKVPLHLAVCDEAQVVKNAGTKAAQALRRLDARQRLCLTGTPLENHLGELHSQLTWAAPGLFGSRATFDDVYTKPIAEGVAGRAEALRRRLKAVLLRRTKQQVASDLPPRSESVITIELGAKQRALYESIRLAMDKRVRDAIAAKGLARSGIEVIEALLRLRQTACDPALLGSPEGKACGESAKLDHLREMLPTLIEDGRRILLFSQFTSFLDRIEEAVLTPAGLPWLRLDGQTRDRQGLIDRFQAKESPLFLLSLKAGGTGLTLTAADTVILSDPWWNPAVEAQAADRAHRIGQTQPVLIYRLVAAGTIEEKVIALQARKKALADALYDESGQSLGSLTNEDLSALLAPL